MDTFGRRGLLRRHILIGLFLTIMPLAAPVFAAISSEECIGCHEKFKKAYDHGGSSCTGCHKDVREIPHPEKLAKPLCNTCHRETVGLFEKDVHRTKGLTCKDCHDVHFRAMEEKLCASCHTNVAHKVLPHREEHLRKLQCISCHGVLKKSQIEVSLKLNKGRSIPKPILDADGNGFADRAEWLALEGLLSTKLKGSYQITTTYTVLGDVHGVTRSAIACQECHELRNRFGMAILNVLDDTSYQIAADPRNFVPEIPSIKRYNETVHGKAGIKCADCHSGDHKISDSVCATCHSPIPDIYRHTAHAKKGATACTDCHNPHSIKSYKELGAKERIAVCARCHKEYPTQHSWLPNTALHFEYLECGTCHSPQSRKSMVFFFSSRQGGKEFPIRYNDLVRVFGPQVDVEKLIDVDEKGNITSGAMGGFFINLRKRMQTDLFIGADILVTQVYHDFSAKRPRERDCVSCHSKDAGFYSSMFLILPDKWGNVYVPVKGTGLSEYPIAIWVDVSLLGEEKINKLDIITLVRAIKARRPISAQEIGFKWIDLVGVLLLIVVLLFMLLHAVLRAVVRR